MCDSLDVNVVPMDRWCWVDVIAGFLELGRVALDVDFVSAYWIHVTLSSSDNWLVKCTYVRFREADQGGPSDILILDTPKKLSRY